MEKEDKHHRYHLYDHYKKWLSIDSSINFWSWLRNE